jgi:hypothetical protein
VADLLRYAVIAVGSVNLVMVLAVLRDLRREPRPEAPNLLLGLGGYAVVCAGLGASTFSRLGQQLNPWLLIIVVGLAMTAVACFRAATRW